MPTAVDPALIPTTRFEGSSIGTALLSYVTIANFRHKHKGKALAGGLVHANVRALRRSGCGPLHFPAQVDHGTRASATTIALSARKALIDRRQLLGAK
jgi:hypothetical protein